MSQPDVMNTSSMCEALAARGVDGLHTEVFDALPSTSEYLSQISQSLPASDAITPQLCVADWQTNGNGRRGKTWVTERGNITFSMLLSVAKPPAELMGLSLVTGVCVAESLAAVAGLAVNLKWPNDVLVDDKKLCGLLTELGSSTATQTRLITGIGINYMPPAAMENSDYQAVSVPMLTPKPPSRADLISDVCARILEAYALFETSGWPPFSERWDRYDYLKGRQVRVISAGAEERAVAIGVDERGALLVEADGETRAVYSGEVSLRLA